MSQELFYTSAPRGLQPGSRGFCTVAATTGMPAALMEKLESLSGYRPLFPPLDGKSGLNPIVYSHLRLVLGGKTYSILSRICSAGLDYTERTNKFAHHVVLESGELPPGGPAWLMRQAGFMEATWDGQVRMLTTGRVPPSGDSSASVCKAWQNLTGDAGWAGVVAEAFTKNSGPPSYLIFEPGMELLPLIDEVLSLLPAEQRWQVSFSTYFTGLPQGVNCLWRGVPADSAEAKNASRLPDALILNLCRPLGEATGGALAEQARTGIPPQAFQSELPESGLTGESLPERGSGGKVRSREMGRPKRQAAGFGPRLPQQLPASAPGFPEPTPSGDVHVSGFDAPPLHLRERAKIESRTSKSGVWLVGFGLGAVMGILLTVTLITTIWFFSGYELVRPADRAARQSANQFANNGPNAEREEPNRQPENQQSVVASKPKDKSEPKNEGNPASAPAAKLPSGAKSQNGNSKKGSTTRKSPNIDGELRPGPAKISYVRLPPRPKNGLVAEDGEAKPLLEKILEPGKGPVDLVLHGSEKLSTGKDQKSNLIVRYLTSEAGVGAPVPKDLAEFGLGNGKLLFRWLDKNESTARAARSLLPHAIVEIRSGEKLYVALREPVEEKSPLPLFFDEMNHNYRYRLKWDEEKSPRPPGQVHLDPSSIAFEGAPLLEFKPEGKPHMLFRPKSRFVIAPTNKPKVQVNELTIEIRKADEIVVELKTSPPPPDPDMQGRNVLPGPVTISGSPPGLSDEDVKFIERNTGVSRVDLDLLSTVVLPVNFPLAFNVGFRAFRAPESHPPAQLSLKSLVLYVKNKDIRVDVYRVKPPVEK